MSLVVSSAKGQGSVPLESLAARIREQVAQLNGAAGIIRSSAFNCALHAIDVGKLLIEAKKRVGHGHFMEWLPKNVPDVPGRTLRRYMAMARKWPNLANSETYHPAIAAYLSAGEGKVPPVRTARTVRQSDTIQKSLKSGKALVKNLEAARQGGALPGDAQLAGFRDVHKQLGVLLAAWDADGGSGGQALPVSPVANPDR